MSIITVPFSALIPGTQNPRKVSDEKLIAGLAASIKADGLLHNLVVQKAKRRKYRVIAGNRRYRALALLKADGEIGDDYPVPVEVRETTDGDAFRLATIENVQRERLNPIDEAEAIAALLQDGAAIDDVSAKTGMGESMIRRRLALANLCEEAKQAVRSGDLPLGVAEALTLGTHDAQRDIVGQLATGYVYDAMDIRYMLTEAKPSVALALFPLSDYDGTLTADLFADEETTYFDDVAQFFRLQEAAVEQRADEYRDSAAWVEVVKASSVPWWQYRTAGDDETGGVIIHLSPSGRVEIRENLLKHEVEARTAALTRTQTRTRSTPAYTAALVRYVALQKSAMVQAALLENWRKAKEMAVCELLRGILHGGHIRIDVHPWLPATADKPMQHTGTAAVHAELSYLAGLLRPERQDDDPDLFGWGVFVHAIRDNDDLHEAVTRLADEDLDRILVVIPILAIGQHELDRLGTPDKPFGRFALDLGVEVRRMWRPDAAFLEQLKRAELCEVATQSGASGSMGRLADYKKGELVRFLESYFERTAGREPHAEESREKGRTWVPEVMAFWSTEDAEKEEGA